MTCGSIIITVKRDLQLFYISYQPYAYNIHTSKKLIKTSENIVFQCTYFLNQNPVSNCVYLRRIVVTAVVKFEQKLLFKSSIIIGHSDLSIKMSANRQHYTQRMKT